MIYKVVSQHALSEWSNHHQVDQEYLWYGEGIDLRDHYIHCSTQAQLTQTLSIYFTGRTDLILLTFDDHDPTLSVTWESSRDQKLFPHIYHGISFNQIRAQYPLVLSESQQHILPWS